MRSQLISPSLRVYGALINAHVKAGDLAGGFALKRKMESEGFKPDVVIYTSLINGLVRDAIKVCVCLSVLIYVTVYLSLSVCLYMRDVNTNA